MLYCLAARPSRGMQIWCSLKNCRSSLMGKFQAFWLCIHICASFLPSEPWLSPHSHDLFFSLEAHSCSHLIFSFFHALWLNISRSCVFPLWGSAALIAKQQDSSSALSGSEALPNFSRVLCVCLLLLWVRWDRWVTEAAPSSFRPWLVM